MKRKLWITGLILAAMTLTCGCGSKDKEQESTQAESVTETEAAQESTAAETVSGTVETAPEQEQAEVQPVVEELPKTGRAVVDIPEEFREYLPPSGIYVSKNYPTDGSNIYILTTVLYEIPDMETYKIEINDSLSSQTGRDVSINLESYELDTLDGCDMLKTVFTYSYDGMKFRRTEYTVNTDITTVIAYTQVGSVDWSEEFEESAFSMRIE